MRNFTRHPPGRRTLAGHFFGKPLLSALLLGCSLEAAAAGAVDINAANASELAAALVGVGQSKAEAIVDYRDANGPFKSVDDLALVKGIGAATIDRNRDKLSVTAPAKQ
jgi:competence protein ComEA